MAEVNCWACLSTLKERQKVCLECNSWQNWRSFLSISNTSIVLLIALMAVVTPVSATVFRLYKEFYPDLEVHLSGHFNVSSQMITLHAYNFGAKPAVFGANLRCTFGLENAMGHIKENEGLEIEFWSVNQSIVKPESALQIEFNPQISAFDPMQEQVICFGALNYLDRTTLVEPFFLAIVPSSNQTWWPIEGIATTKEGIEFLYPKDVVFQ